MGSFSRGSSITRKTQTSPAAIIAMGGLDIPIQPQIIIDPPKPKKPRSKAGLAHERVHKHDEEGDNDDGDFSIAAGPKHTHLEETGVSQESLPPTQEGGSKKRVRKYGKNRN